MTSQDTRCYGRSEYQQLIFEPKWYARFLLMAEHVAGWSKDPSTKVGAVIARPDKTVASIGFNGFPRRVVDATSLLEDRQAKYARVIHAEMNAILHAKEPLLGCVLCVTHPPCSSCVAALIQSGLSEVHWIAPSREFAERWAESTRIATDLLKEAGVLHGSVARADLDRWSRSTY